MMSHTHTPNQCFFSMADSKVAGCLMKMFLCSVLDQNNNDNNNPMLKELGKLWLIICPPNCGLGNECSPVWCLNNLYNSHGRITKHPSSEGVLLLLLCVCKLLLSSTQKNHPRNLVGLILPNSFYTVNHINK